MPEGNRSEHADPSGVRETSVSDKGRDLMAYYGEQEKKTLERFWDEQAGWSRAVFGSDEERGPAGPLKHLLKEAQEALDDPSDVIEIIDCLFLVFDAARRAGLTYDQVVELAFHKLEINRARKWPAPTSSLDDLPVEHIRKHS